MDPRAAGTEADGDGETRLTKGERTRARLVAAAEEVFGEGTYDAASIVEITRRAGVSQGTFYLYFPSKLEIFREVVKDLGRQLRAQLSEATRDVGSRADAERAGFASFFGFVGEHPNLYRIIRQAEFVDRDTYREHYERLAAPYVRGLTEAAARGEIRSTDPEVVAYCLMGIGEMIGMRWLLWDGKERAQMPKKIFEALSDFILHGVLAADER